jgi:hypothetical protein
MMDNQHVGDNHNAPVFQWCYKRMGEFVPQLVGEGKQPRAMLEYTGTLLHGLRQMGCARCDGRAAAHHGRPRLPALRGMAGLSVGPRRGAVHAAAGLPSARAGLAAALRLLFGVEALERVKGFSPSEMALPNHPDVAYAFVKTLRDCGFTWVIVQEHTVELADGRGLERRHIPHRLVATSSTGETASIIAIIKTQGSDTKLVAQMQPWYEAASLSRWELAGRQIPPLVTQIADGENGGVMMNEFPHKFIEVVRNASHTDTPLMNGSEYLEHLFALGLKDTDLPEVRPLFSKRIWDRMKPGAGPEKLKKVVEELRKEDHRFHMEGGSWTSNISWVSGYENVLGPMDQVSALFNEKVLKRNIKTTDPRYRNALFYLLSSARPVATATGARACGPTTRGKSAGEPAIF